MQAIHAGDTKRRRWRLTQGRKRIDLTPAASVAIRVIPVDAPGAIAFTDDVEIIDTVGGIVRWAPLSVQVAIPGIYHVVFVITWNDGRTESVPDDGYEDLVIRP